MTSKKNSSQVEVELPKNIQLGVDGMKITVTGGKGNLAREFKNQQITFTKKDNILLIKNNSKRKKETACLKTLRAHVINMIHGVTEGITYDMKIVYSHFPMTVKIDGKHVLIDNFLGEKNPRISDIHDGVTVEVNGADVKVSGLSKDAVSQTAANIEQVTKIKNLDPRVFQDGIYITSKDGKPVR